MTPSRAWIPNRSDTMNSNSYRRDRSGHARLRRQSSAFTLVELLTVITIIMILAGLTVGGLGFYNRKVAEDKTRLQLKLISSGLEAYYFDNGEYPEANNTQGSGQSDELYIALFYDCDEDGQNYKNDDDQTIYVPDFDPGSNSQGWISGSGTNVKIMDGFGNEYRYRRLTNPSRMRNPDFDLWSVGADGKTNASRIEHDNNKDDIWDR